ncbi:branched-chain amino acid transport system substrate-binding protein [Nocardioides marinisabuli]|uniref:Branched-chain amino acid transport system substrate-binding protein n=1 Tax=Nocardioides marinisabuli TaxID=419476 RepID=A0A7Y9F0A5_9ACTN|nr:ABC transporter substrate-binding protein [Nocardioides marinisabuli]NYD57184.1 branched-chain amino acid transport system substrate-binding protein [Nocardioides marinisabuli]
MAALSLAAACTTSSDAGSSGSTGVQDATGAAVTADATYKLGLALPFTGPAASYGEEYRIAVQLGIDDANEQFASDGIQLEMVTQDSQATAEGGVNAMNRLGAVDEAPAVLTAWSAVVASGASVAQDLGFAMFNAGAQSPSLIGTPHLVNALPMNDAQLSNFSQYLMEEKGYEDFAIIYVDNESGQGTADAFTEAVEERGGSIVAEESIRQDATDATTQIAKIQESGADFVYIQTLLVEGAATMQAAREANLQIPLGSYAGFGESRVIRDAGQEAMNGLIYMSHIPEDMDAVRGLLDRMQAVEPERVLANQSYNSYFYAVPFIYAEAIKILREQGAPVTGENVLAVLDDEALTAPILGDVDLTNQLTYTGPTLIQQIDDYQADPLDDTTVDAVSAD